MLVGTAPRHDPSASGVLTIAVMARLSLARQPAADRLHSRARRHTPAAVRGHHGPRVERVYLQSYDHRDSLLSTARVAWMLREFQSQLSIAVDRANILPLFATTR